MFNQCYQEINESDAQTFQNGVSSIDQI